jgi:hypothetical protein
MIRFTKADAGTVSLDPENDVRSVFLWKRKKQLGESHIILHTFAIHRVENFDVREKITCILSFRCTVSSSISIHMPIKLFWAAESDFIAYTSSIIDMPPASHGIVCAGLELWSPQSLSRIFASEEASSNSISKFALMF